MILMYKSEKEFLKYNPWYKRWDRFYREVDKLSKIKGKETHVQISDEYPPRGKKKGEIWVYGSGDKKIVREAVKRVFGSKYIVKFAEIKMKGRIRRR